MTDSPMRVLVTGVPGQMATQVVATLTSQPGLQVVGVTSIVLPAGSFALPDGATVPCGADAGAILDQVKPDMVVDFTVAEAALQTARAALPRRVPMVIGTTGLSEAEVAEIGALAEQNQVGAMLAANFAIGAVLMMHMANLAARYFDHAEIIELHHDRKVDAPSGTALATARGMLAARGQAFRHQGAEKTPLTGTRGGELDGIAIHSVRLPGLVAHQEVLFGGLGQTLSLRHDTTSRESFMPGVLLAIRELPKRRGLIRGLDTLMGLSD